ncbi:MAG TPA: choice-of-anchor tandem repeat GloVer-containing protein, partial [Verrucomicrobiae bacterium]|nr:choice-of-anchor tandem repeat GloVer-containing protein [Verrucomicrobiae bacterium]
YELNANGTGYGVLYSFSVSGSDGESCYSALMQGSNGKFYGTTLVGGTNNAGTVFRLDSDGANYAILHSFGSSPDDGRNPHAATIQASDGRLYGTTEQGGQNNLGTVFAINSNGGEYKIIHEFAGGSEDGAWPDAELVLGNDGALYGTTGYGGNRNGGTVFKISTNGLTYSVLHNFSADASDGRHPLAGLMQAGNGLFYGTTQFGGTNNLGTVFAINSDGTAYAVLHSFSGVPEDGQGPFADLLQCEDGLLYGTTSAGGSFGSGTIFTIGIDGTAYRVLRSFGETGDLPEGAADGGVPTGSLVQGVDGALYGTTSRGEWISGLFGAHRPGRTAYGILFKMNTNGYPYEVLHKFGFADGDGEGPFAGLTRGNYGFFYGSTASGGGMNLGTVFKWISPSVLPSIVNQPSNQMVVQGDPANFNVTASGASPLNYQWFYNSNSLADATNSTLVLDNVQPTNAGVYSVLVTNIYGSILSSNANLDVLPAGIVLLNPVADARIGNLLGEDGGSIYLSVYNSAGNTQRALLRFDLSSLAANKIVTNAVLKLYADASLWSDGNPGGEPMEIYRVTQPWDEAQVSWSQRMTGSSWTISGGDYVGMSGTPDTAPYATNDTAVPGGYFSVSPVELDWNVTDLVKEWQTGTQANEGLLVLSYPGNGLHFHSRESGANIPELMVYTTDASSVQTGLRMTSSSRANLYLKWGAMYGYSYQLQFKTNLSQPNWVNWGGTIIATNVIMNVPALIGPEPQRFYRIVLKP